MTEKNIPIASVDPSLLSGSTLSRQELSTERVRLLTEAAGSMATSIPEFMGMTLFGSTARGEARPNSDVDIFVLVNPDNLPLRYERTSLGGTTGTVEFTKWIRPNEEEISRIRQTTQAHGLDKIGLIVLPFNDAIFEQTISDLIEVATLWDSGDHSIGAQVPRNIRALFHVPIHDTELQPYIERTLTTLNNSPHGTIAWRMIRHQLVSLELPKMRTDDDFIKGLAHRYIPTTLDEAIQVYS